MGCLAFPAVLDATVGGETIVTGAGPGGRPGKPPVVCFVLVCG